MATGDIRNNLKMLSAEIRSVKTPSALLNLEGMMAGDPEVYLPIYDYLFQWYNTRLANEILRRDLKLPPYKHNRTKFLETMYLVLRELFQWKPPLSSSQFFSSGFAEKKIIMCRDIVKLIKEYSSSQKPASQAATSPASTASRPKAQKVPAAKSSAAVTKASLQPAAPTNGAVSREKPPSSKAVLSAKVLLKLSDLRVKFSWTNKPTITQSACHVHRIARQASSCCSTGAFMHLGLTSLTGGSFFLQLNPHFGHTVVYLQQQYQLFCCFSFTEKPKQSMQSCHFLPFKKYILFHFYSSAYMCKK
ncbi:centrosomal protein of 44 kDa-like isoform X5 [Dermacentor albipictus]|uniref:centrosomal protein of 44 kDa-like isoform X5 n=1 Tax=Dermacentor albipictus TaxID=60249 RepID=UPI0038FCA575